jgi:hypothetical protein
MVRKPQIKIIKRSERSRLEKKPTKFENKKKSKQETARDMVSTVSNWVTDFQQRRRDETKQALKKLFPDTPRPSQA